MSTFPTGAIEKLPWGALVPDVVRPADTFSNVGGAAGASSPRRKWSAADVWRRMELQQEDQHARVRFQRAPICTPPLPDPYAAVSERYDRRRQAPVQEDAPVDTSAVTNVWNLSHVVDPPNHPVSSNASVAPSVPEDTSPVHRRHQERQSPRRQVMRRGPAGDWELTSTGSVESDYGWFLDSSPRISGRIPGFEDKYYSHRQLFDKYVNARIQHL